MDGLVQTRERFFLIGIYIRHQWNALGHHVLALLRGFGTSLLDVRALCWPQASPPAAHSPLAWPSPRHQPVGALPRGKGGLRGRAGELLPAVPGLAPPQLPRGLPKLLAPPNIPGRQDYLAGLSCLGGGGSSTCFLPPKRNFPLPGLTEKPNKKRYPTNPTAREIGFVQQRDLKLRSCKLFHLQMLKPTAAVFLQKPQPEKPEVSGKPRLWGELLGAGTAAPADQAIRHVALWLRCSSPKKPPWVN